MVAWVPVWLFLVWLVLKNFSIPSSITLAWETFFSAHLARKADTISFGSSAWTLLYTLSLYRRLTSVLVVVLRLFSIDFTPKLW